MDEHEALMRTVLAHPDDDLPRQVLADWLEEHDEVDRACFIRDQIEYASVRPWEPYAVRCQHARPNTITGRPWRSALPPVESRFWEWHPTTPFRRGFGWSLVVRDLQAFLPESHRLFAAAPIGQLYLPTATREQWFLFAEQPWLPQIKSIHFYGVSTPIEPLRVLCDTSAATGLEELVLEKAGGPAIPELLDGLFHSQMGWQLKKLGLRVCSDGESEWIQQFRHLHRVGQLEELSLVTMGISVASIRMLLRCRVMEQLTRLELKNNPLYDDGVSRLVRSGVIKNLTSLSLVGSLASEKSTLSMRDSAYLRKLQQLDWSENPLYYFHDLSRFDCPDLRSILLRRCQILDDAIPHLTTAPFWPNLVELDLSHNPLTDVAARHLMRAERPANLTALLLDHTLISVDRLRDLQQHFGPAVVLQKASGEQNPAEAQISPTGGIR